MDKCIITSCSNSFFPSLLNLLGSIKINYPSHPKIFIYTLNLSSIFKKILKNIDNVDIIEMPHFCNFWRSCYTWKTYILARPIARINLYLDAGNQILKPLDEIFRQIEDRDYFFVDQGGLLKTIVPQDYITTFSIENDILSLSYVAAGIVGFKQNSTITPILNELHTLALDGLCLGFSRSERWRNYGKNKNPFTRECKTFRHDQTLLNILIRKHIKNLYINNLNQYGGWASSNEHPEQFIWNLRANYIHLRYKYICLTKHKLFYEMILELFIGILLVKKLVYKVIKNVQTNILYNNV